MAARFHIKVNPHGGIALRDRHAPAFVRNFPDLAAAVLAMDNRVRAEWGMRPRVALTRQEIREAMNARAVSSQAGLASFVRSSATGDLLFPRDFDEAVER